MKINQKSLSRLNWTAQVKISVTQEEQFVWFQREQKGINSWTAISKELNKLFENKNRSGKQCRERFMNYIRFSKNLDMNSRWTQAEDEKLFTLFMVHGRKWVSICRQMQNRYESQEFRSENCLKNRFYGAIRKIHRRIDKAIKLKKIKQKKFNKQAIYLEILEIMPSNEDKNANNSDKFFQLIARLQTDLIKLALAPEQQTKVDQICGLIDHINLYISCKKHFSENKMRQKLSSKNGVSQNGHGSVSFSDKQVLQELTLIIDQIESPYQKVQSQAELAFCDSNIEANFKELGLFYEPHSGHNNQDLEKQVNQIMDSEIFTHHIDF